MRTLDHWKSKLTVIPNSIECPQMRLLTGRDHEPPVFIGPGHIDIKNSTSADFRIFAPAQKDASALLKVYSAHSNPYEMLDQFRLFAVDFEGTEWACGWTVPKIEHASSQGALVTGRVTSLSTRIIGDYVSTTSGVELLFQPSFHIPMEESMLTIHSIGDEEVHRSRRVGKQTLKLLGSVIEFSQDPVDDLLWITATASEELPHVFLENWVLRRDYPGITRIEMGLVSDSRQRCRRPRKNPFGGQGARARVLGRRHRQHQGSRVGLEGRQQTDVACPEFDRLHERKDCRKVSGGVGPTTGDRIPPCKGLEVCEE